MPVALNRRDRGVVQIILLIGLRHGISGKGTVYMTLVDGNQKGCSC